MFWVWSYNIAKNTFLNISFKATLNQCLLDAALCKKKKKATHRKCKNIVLFYKVHNTGPSPNKQTLAPHQDLTRQNLWMSHARTKTLQRGQFSCTQALLIHFNIILFYSNNRFRHPFCSLHPSILNMLSENLNIAVSCLSYLEADWVFCTQCLSGHDKTKITLDNIDIWFTL